MYTKHDDNIKIEHDIIAKMNEMMCSILAMETDMFKKLSEIMRLHGVDLFDKDKDASFVQCRHLTLISMIGDKYTQMVQTILNEYTPVNHIIKQENEEDQQMSNHTRESTNNNQAILEPIGSPTVVIKHEENNPIIQEQNDNHTEYDHDEETETKHETATPSNNMIEQVASGGDGNDWLFRYKCTHCEQRLQSQSAFENHNWFEHKDTKPWKCSQCSDMFKTSCGLCCHIRSHNKESWFQCDQCDKSFPRKGTLNVHKRIHSNSGEKPFQCDVCGKKCRNIKKYKQHQKKCKKIHNEMMRIKCTKVNTLYSGIYYYYK
eukprot:237635_1